MLQKGKFLTSFPVFITWRRLPSAHSVHLLSLEARRLVHYRMTERSVTVVCPASEALSTLDQVVKQFFALEEWPPRNMNWLGTPRSQAWIGNQATINNFFSEQQMNLSPGNWQRNAQVERKPANTNAGMTASLSATQQKMESHQLCSVPIALETMKRTKETLHSTGCFSKEFGGFVSLGRRQES